MLLVIDVGNTNITLGIFKEENLLATIRMTTKPARTSDEFGILIRLMIQERGLDKDNVRVVIISSVVPDVMYSLNSAIIKYFHTRPLNVGPGIKTGIRIATDNPKEIGANRIVDAVAGYTLYGGPILVIDYGTGATYENLKVVATGGLGKIIAYETDKIDVYDNMLTLKCLRIIYQKNR